MEQLVLNNELALRVGVAAGIFLVMGLWEAIAPRRHRVYPRIQRWGRNLGLVLCGAVLLRLVVPVAAVAVAVTMREQNFGLFNLIDLPVIVEVVVAVVLLDFGIYLQHVISHKIPLLWRLHRVHHADPDFDVTTALRFHPIEIVLSMLYKFALIALLGPSAMAVVLFEIVLNGTAMFNHSNVTLGKSIDRVVRLLLVTPDMHRVHHSIIPVETNSNYGFSLAVWDRLFGTYRAQPREGHDNMTIGMPLAGGYFTCVQLTRMLGLPFFHPSAEPPPRHIETNN